MLVNAAHLQIDVLRAVWDAGHRGGHWVRLRAGAREVGVRELDGLIHLCACLECGMCVDRQMVCVERMEVASRSGTKRVQRKRICARICMHTQLLHTPTAQMMKITKMLEMRCARLSSQERTLGVCGCGEVSISVRVHAYIHIHTHVGTECSPYQHVLAPECCGLAREQPPLPLLGHLLPLVLGVCVFSLYCVTPSSCVLDSFKVQRTPPPFWCASTTTATHARERNDATRVLKHTQKERN